MLSIYVCNLLVHLTEKFRVELISNSTRSRASQDVLNVAPRSVAGLHFFLFGFIVSFYAIGAPGFHGYHCAQATLSISVFLYQI